MMKKVLKDRDQADSEIWQHLLQGLREVQGPLAIDISGWKISTIYIITSQAGEHPGENLEVIWAEFSTLS
jgi:hypothetical protein